MCKSSYFIGNKINRELGLKSANSLLILQTIDNNLFVFFDSILIFTNSIFDISLAFIFNIFFKMSLTFSNLLLQEFLAEFSNPV
ncbi:MAG: hypothetical protein K2L64_00745 [Ureaplasma sp.]|nr:hypothetical protein [Ureaplasma sp.]